MALTSKDLPMGGQDYGPLRDPARRAGCLAHAGAPGATVLGARQVDWAGRPGVLLVLPAGEPGRLRVLVVSLDCAADRGEVLADTRSAAESAAESADAEPWARTGQRSVSSSQS